MRDALDGGYTRPTMDSQLLTTDDELSALLSDVRDFHDGRLREAQVVFGTFTDAAASVQTGRDDRATCRLIVETPSGPHGRMRVVELRFDDLVACHVRPVGPGYDATILSAEIVRRDDVFYWCLAESLIGGVDSTWVGGRRLSWRVREKG
jgi:hypothetical protein